MPSYDNYEYLFKILLIGDAGVGKTSMLARFADDTYSENYISTIGVDFKIKTVAINNILIKLQIWDTAGQDRFRSITSNYYRGAHGMIIAFDITDYESFDDVNMWLSEIDKYSNMATMRLLVGCKADLEHKRNVSYDTAKNFADEKGMQYIEVSAKNSFNIDQAFFQLGEQLVEKAAAAKMVLPVNDIKLDTAKKVTRLSTCC